MKWRTNKHSSSNACLSNFISLYIFLSVYHSIYPSIYRTINLQQTTCLFNVLPLFLSPITSYRVFQKWFVSFKMFSFCHHFPTRVVKNTVQLYCIWRFLGSSNYTGNVLNIVFFLQMLWFFWTLQVLLQRWCSTCHCVLTLTPRGNQERPGSGIYLNIFEKHNI